MITHEFFINNIACGDCMKRINASLLNIKDVASINFFEIENKVSVTGMDLKRQEIIDSLATLGYHDKDNNGVFRMANKFEHWYCYCCSGCDG